jgi:hypothetical protein
MKRTRISALLVLLILIGRSAFAHRIDEYLQATLFSLEPGQLRGSMRLVPGVLVAPTVIGGIDSNADGTLSAAEEQVYAQRVLADLSITLDGRSVSPRLLSYSFPTIADMRHGLGEIHIEYAINLPSDRSANALLVTNHHLSRTSVYLMNATVPDDARFRIVAQKRNEQQSSYELDFQQATVTASRSHGDFVAFQAWLSGVQFSPLFHLGMRHIAEGTDHLLFLLTLLLPAPLVLSSKRWGGPAGVRESLRHILSIVTAFTIGHSITLTLAALGMVHVPSRPVEVLVAVSIFVSALHALRPIVPGRESYIAVFFGLVHGLAFAATLDRLALGRWDRVAGILAFNLGIETMQLLAVAVILPSLILLSRTTAYSMLRIGGALFAAAASLAWTLQRLFGIAIPVDTFVDGLAHHALWIAIILFVASLVLSLVANRRTGPHLETSRISRADVLGGV